jgi:hypothetical protein
MSGEPKNEFVFSFPCYTVHVDGIGIAVPVSEGGRHAQIFTDDDAADRFIEMARAGGRTANLFEITEVGDLLRVLLEAKRQIATMVAFDSSRLGPEDPNLAPVGFKVRATEIDRAIAAVREQLGE